MAPTRRNKKDKKDKKNKKSRKCYRKKQAGGSMAQSLAQGRQYAEFHANQHGGAYLTGAPLSQIAGSMLPQEMRSFARIGGLDDSISAAREQGPDQASPMPAPATQAGGRRTGRKGRKASKKSKKSKGRKASKKSKKSKGRKASKKSKKSRRQAGGALGAPFNGSTMLLTPAEAAKADTADFRNPLLKF